MAESSDEPPELVKEGSKALEGGASALVKEPSKMMEGALAKEPTRTLSDAVTFGDEDAEKIMTVNDLETLHEIFMVNAYIYN